MVRVRAKQMGQTPDGKWVRAGDEFAVPEGKVSKRWMIRLDPEPKDPEPAKAPAHRATRSSKAEDKADAK